VCLLYCCNKLRSVVNGLGAPIETEHRDGAIFVEKCVSSLRY
jgi:hypothetical protein